MAAASSEPRREVEETLELATERISGEFDMVDVAVGARETPRSTSPAAALFTTVNCSFAAADAVVFARVSVIVTSLFGSAP